MRDYSENENERKVHNCGYCGATIDTSHSCDLRNHGCVSKLSASTGVKGALICILVLLLRVALEALLPDCMASYLWEAVQNLAQYVALTIQSMLEATQSTVETS